jgi:hypothetical protein
MPTALSQQLDTNQATVTRVEIADHVEDAFTEGPIDQTALLVAAEATGARPELLAVLAALPHRQYGELRQLWTDLPEVPIGW